MSDELKTTREIELEQKLKATREELAYTSERITELYTALSDAVSVFTNADELVVTEERHEAWKHALENGTDK